MFALFLWSTAIEQVCVQLETQFGRNHGFSRYDLFPFVLDDVNPLRRSRQFQAGYRSAISAILKDFNPERGSLTTWTVRLVRRHRELNAFLLECGVYLISDWAILNDTSLQQVRRILTEFHTLTEGEVQSACHLLDAYHAVYRQDRLELRRLGNAGRCQQPSADQLERMHAYLQSGDRDPMGLLETVQPIRLLGLLQSLADRLRQYRIYARGGPTAAESLDGDTFVGKPLQVEDPRKGGSDREEQNEFLSFYREQFSHCMDRAISGTIERWVSTMQRKKTPKHEQFLQALSLFHDRGLSMGEIAPLVGLQAQYQVSRLLKLKQLRADIRRSLLVELQDSIMQKAESYHWDLDRLQDIDGKIEAALCEQVDDVLQEAASEASVAQRHSAPSLYSRRLCQYLNSRSQES